MKKKSILPALIAIAIVVAIIVGFGINKTKDIGKTQNTISREQALNQLSRLYSKVDIDTGTPEKAPITSLKSDVADELPDIDKSYPLTVVGKEDINIEIFTSTEKGGSGTDGWLNEVAEDFNAQGFEINGKKLSVSIRSIATGTAVEYINSKKYTPDGYTPSNEFFGEMVASSGIKVSKIKDKLVGNTGGILLSKSAIEKIEQKYGDVNFKTVVQATQDSEITMGYTNPLSSATGLNFLISTLYSYDSKNILSDAAVEGFNAFQKNVPLVSFTTLQMRESAESGVLDGFIMEYQTYINDKSLSSYEFIPFGATHNNPLYSIGVHSDEKEESLKKFADYCVNEKSQELATKYGFNNSLNYKSDMPIPDGKSCIAAQKLWKDNKNAGQEIISIFAVDTSGSMDGDPLNTLKKSLINSINYISSDAYVGLITYDDVVTKWLDISKFDLNQKAYFNGAVQNMTAGGTTAIYSGIVVGLQMLEDSLADHPNAKPMLFVLSDGASFGESLSLNDIKETVDGLNIPIYTIGYGTDADMDALGKVSSINEAASISATTDDVVYKIKNLFNAEL